MANSHPDDEHMAYGEYHGEQGGSTEKGLFGSVFGRSKSSQAGSVSQAMTQSCIMS